MMYLVLMRYMLVGIAAAVVLYPLWVRFTNVGLVFVDGGLVVLFPYFGLIAFTIMWLHVVGGVFKLWLNRFIDFEAFVHNSSLIVLVSIILHPLLLFIALGFSNFNVLFSSESARFIILGIIGLFLLITYDIGKALKKRAFFTRNWDNIRFISTIGFLLIFFHSLGIGSDLQSGTLRMVWIFYGVTGIIATVYTYGIRRQQTTPR